MKRNYDHAYFENEKGAPVPGDSLFFNKFNPKPNPRNTFDDKENQLDPAVRRQRQPQAVPKSKTPLRHRVDFFIGSRTAARIDQARAARAQIPEVKVTLLYGVGRDLDNLGLRYFFEQVDDRVLINISGVEEGSKWGVGISGLEDASRGIKEDQIKFSFAGGGFGDVPYKITTLAAYSTGFHGLNLSVTEDLIPLGDIDTVVYYDCIYRHDISAAAAGDPPAAITSRETNSGADELDAQHSRSAFNTRRALTKLARASAATINVVGYAATSSGTPFYLRPTSSSPQLTVDIPNLIDLRSPSTGSPVTPAECLFALVLSRCLAYAVTDGQVRPTEVPAPFRALAGLLPARGQIASTTRTHRAKPGFVPTTTLLDWGTVNRSNVKDAQKGLNAAIKLVSERWLMYMGAEAGQAAYPDPGNAGGVLHAGLLPEFGWEYLV
jgi:hypothetical protein